MITVIISKEVIILFYSITRCLNIGRLYVNNNNNTLCAGFFMMVPANIIIHPILIERYQYESLSQEKSESG